MLVDDRFPDYRWVAYEDALDSQAARILLHPSVTGRLFRHHRRRDDVAGEDAVHCKRALGGRTGDGAPGRPIRFRKWPRPAQKR
jgi:hypothetical protein